MKADAVVAIDHAGTILAFDSMAEKLFGYPARDVVGQNVTMLMPLEYRESHSSQLTRHLTTGETHLIGREVQLEALRADGSRIGIVLRVSEVRSRGATIFVAAISDVGTRGVVREASWYRDVFDSALVGIVLVDESGNFLWTNRRTTEILGYSFEELRTMRFQEVTHPEDRERDVANLKLLLAGELSFYQTEKRYLRKDAGPVWVQLWTRLVRDESTGAPRYFVSIIEDIDARKRAEDADRMTLSLLRAALDATTDGILVVGLDGTITSHNRNFTALWRMPESAMESGDRKVALASVLEKLVDPEGFVERLQDLHDRPNAEGFDVIELRDGRVFERYSKPQMLGEQIVGRVWSFRDVSQQREADERLRSSQEQLAHSQKMEAMGRLAGGVAHDFNNLLSVITGYANLLEVSLPEGDPRLALVKPIADAVDRASALTTQLLAFSRKQPREVALLDLNAVVRGVEEMLGRLLGEHVNLEISLSPGLWPVFADRGQIEQVLVNLAVNARDAMPDGGTLRVSTENLALETNAVRLAVADSGVGIDAKTLSRIFEPFFTTKGPGHGTGLGLSTVHGIVEQSGGTIEVESEPGRGATFVVTLPASRGARPEAPTERQARATPRRGHETILVVEDHVELRSLVRVILENHGYRVLLAVTPAEAVAVARSERIDLLVTDVVLPRSSGPEIYEELHEEHADLAVLFVSGYVELHGRAVFDPKAPFLAKPFTPDALATKVREVLDAT